MKGWSEYEHKMSFNTVQVLKSQNLDLGHLELKIPDGESHGCYLIQIHLLTPKNSVSLN